ncbi:MAG: crotonase/enoyl-CoA hydratase family protein [Rubrivivax sp.]|nr:crotonase/enoyl-CoA hydratase family protein [Rubrivivax sp.]MDP3223769.1 crotonase/enoyl-CoA hydratase family protein [Rubrivivax sp.]MDP3610540.1 crotonase/enoyl-CoA hydratase family protein [Rubrivivax sp.]
MNTETPALQTLQVSSGPLSSLPLLQLQEAGPVLHLRLNRPAKRNSISDELLSQLHTVFVNMPARFKVALISGEGDHFCAGLDLSEVSERNISEGMQHSRAWHACFDAIQFGPVPVIAVLHGAVVGGGLELAGSAHLRVAESSAFYALPEGTRGIFVGGGGSVRISRLVGVARMTDMMLTGRVFDANEGQTLALSNYLVGAGEGLSTALALAQKIALNAPLSNYAITQALPRIADLPAADGLFMESLISSIAQGDDAAKDRVRAFLEKRAAKVDAPR